MMHLDNEEKWRDPSKFTGIQPVTPRAQAAPPVVSVTSHQQAALPSPVAEGGPPQEQQYARGSSLMRILGDGMVGSLSNIVPSPLVGVATQPCPFHPACHTSHPGLS